MALRSESFKDIVLQTSAAPYPHPARKDKNPAAPTFWYRPRVTATSSTGQGPDLAHPFNPSLRDSLQAFLGPDGVSRRAEDLQTYSYDLWPRGLITASGEKPPESPPGLIVWPRSEAEVAGVLRLCSAAGAPVVPYGAGSGVAGAAVGPPGSVVLDTKRMTRVDIDPDRGVVTFDPGILGWHLEERLNRRGLSLGHFPSSIMCSTAGGWLATRGAGQMSTKYGKIEDLVRRLTLCTGAGEIVACENGDFGGADWVQLVVGSEGTLGVITSATCTVRPMPALRRLRGYAFPSVESACDAIRHILQLGMRPAVVRLYDEIDTLINGLGRHSGRAKSGGLPFSGPDHFEEILRHLRSDARRLTGRVERWLLKTVLGETEPVTRLISRLLQRVHPESMLILGFEGDEQMTEREDAYAREQMARSGGRDLGEEPGQHWLAHRYDVSFKQPRVFAAGAFADTIEVAATWERLLPLYREVRAAVAPYALCMAHFSHAYPDGCSIYFTMIVRREAGPDLSPAENQRAVQADTARYDAMWQAAMQATLRVGATISHHHGVGRLKTPYLPAEHGASLRILSALQTACDPQHVCNPGNLASPKEPPPAPPRAPDVETSLPKIDAADFLVEAPGTMPLFALEQALRPQRLSLGGLCPWAYGRTLAEALLHPRPSEASLELGRLRDRRVRLRVELPGGAELVIPPQPAPRRATGPDLGQVFLGQTDLYPEPFTLRTATLRVCRLHDEPVENRPGAQRFAGYLFYSAEAAVRAMLLARSLHGGAAFSDLYVVDEALFHRVLAGKPHPSSFGFGLLARAAGPAELAAVALKTLHARIMAGRPEDAPVAELGDALCREILCPDSLCGMAATAESVAEHAGRFPAHEEAIPGKLQSQAALTELLESQAKAGSVSLLCGIYLHGIALCSDRPAPALSQALADLRADEPPAGAVLRSRLHQALRGQ
jgi:alkyldihydroxyacetonephosphate synthase